MSYEAYQEAEQSEAEQSELTQEQLVETGDSDEETTAVVDTAPTDRDDDEPGETAAAQPGDDDDDIADPISDLLDDEEDADDEDEGSPKTLKDQAAKLPSDDAMISVKQHLESNTVGEDGEVRPKRAPKKRWYIVHTYSGHENKVKINLERRIESMNMADKIFRVEVPQKTVTKIKDNRRTEREERIFPGYVLVEMLMDDDSWYVVRHTPGVTKFVGSQKRPIPAKDAEIKRILMRTQPTTTQKVEINLKVGEIVKIISGPFADFEGSVTEISPEKERLKASVIIFGRETPVELAFNQVQKSN